jgi:hypothetical protein
LKGKTWSTVADLKNRMKRSPMGGLAGASEEDLPGILKYLKNE